MRLKKEKIFNINITSADYKKIVQYVSYIIKSKRKIQIVTPNPEFVVMAQKDSEFRNILNRAEVSIPDGAGLILSFIFLGRSNKLRITGVDLMLNLCRQAVERNWTVFL